MACPELQLLSEKMHRGDVPVVWILDCLDRNPKDLLGFVGELESQGEYFVSLEEQLDSTSPVGRLAYQVLSALAGYE